MRWIVIALTLAACSASTGSSMPPLGGADSCGATDFQNFVGQPQEALVGVVFEKPRRIIAPGDAVTQDFVPDRLNFDLDEDGFIVRVRCG